MKAVHPQNSFTGITSYLINPLTLTRTLIQPKYSLFIHNH